MNGFCPDGYVSTQEAILRGAKYWFPEQFAALETAAAPQTEAKPDDSLEALARALPRPHIPDALPLEFQVIVNQTVHRLRNLLHQSELTAYYFGGQFGDGRHAVSSAFWATTAADGAMESGTYWPFGKPTRWYESLPNYSLFLLESVLDALLSDQSANKRPFPLSKMPELIAAMRNLDERLNREKQREALRKSPEFERYHLTDDVFRKAEKQLPRKSGRKPLRPAE